MQTYYKVCSLFMYNAGKNGSEMNIDSEVSVVGHMLTLIMLWLRAEWAR